MLKSIVLRRGLSQSCGCLKLERLAARSTKHGHTTNGVSPTYHSWSGMVARCTNPGHRSYDRYGGRGIGLPGEWRSFAGFLADMGEKPAGTSLERRDNDASYSVENCYWAKPKAQARNKSNNRLVTFRGQRRTLIEWADGLGISQATLAQRIAKWGVERALTTPKLR